MSTPINDGGAAFPVMYVSEGMTLRDYFAAAALKGQAERIANPYVHHTILAADCYALADAMLAARKEVQP
jgi:hypothetical protein